jgi:parallel beta-helix repeat protein
VGLFFVLCFALVTVPAFRIVKAEPNTVVVPDDYSTIQEAINTASKGDIVYVKSGEYLEYLVVNKSVSLVGENKETTTVHRRGQAYPDVYPTIVVRADNVKITGFRIKNEVSSPLIPSGAVDAHSGVHLLNVKHCSLVGNIIVDSGYGVWLFGASENNVSDNHIKTCAHGILVDHSSNNTLIENTVSNCSNGILLSSSPFNTLRRNSVLNTSRNFGVLGSKLSHFLNDVDTSNTIDTNKVYHLVNKKNLTINPSSFPDLGALVIVNCTDITVQNLNITHNFCGLHLFSVTNCKISQNVFSNNTNGGIWFQFVSNCVVSENNVVSNADWGIRVENSHAIIITRNNSTYNQVLSIMLVNSDDNTIAENNVTNFRLKNNGGEKPIYLKSSNNNRIINNQVFDDRGLAGISLINSSYNLVDSNNVTIGGPAIDIRDASCYNRIVSNNFTTDRGSSGVNLFSSFNTFVGNYVFNFSSGFDSCHSSHNLITENTIESRGASFYFYNFSSNQIYRNNIKGQMKVWDLGRDKAGRILSVNQWDNGIEGNYWSDYVKNGTDGYGICDQPYVIDEDNQDTYPLVLPVELFDAGFWEGSHYLVGVVSNSAVSDFSFSPDGTVSFSAEGETGTDGFCRVAIPKDLLDAEKNSWVVLVNDNSITPTVNMDTENTFLNFTYSHSTKTIKIIGTTAIPEFPTWTPLLIILVAVMVVTVVYRRNVSKLAGGNVD